MLSRNDAPVSEVRRKRSFDLTSSKFDELGIGLSVLCFSPSIYRPYTDSQLLTPDVFESVPELKRVRVVTVVVRLIPSVVFDSDSDRVCLINPVLVTPSGSVFDRADDVVVFRMSSSLPLVAASTLSQEDSSK